MAVAAVAVVFAFAAAAPTRELFGRAHFDDGVFFASAKALADGDGYVIPNLPGAPPQTKYPVLYPWLLSWVWRAQPAFPANLSLAVWISALCAAAFLAASYFYVRRQPGVGDWTAAACVALTALHPQTLDLSSSLMSDVPFMAFAVAALLAAEIGLDRGGRPGAMAGAGVACGLAFLTRTAGVAFIGAVAVVAIGRRQYREAAVFVASCAPFVAGHALWKAAVTPLATPASAEPGWVRTAAYMTSYPDFWRLSVPDTDVLLSMLSANLIALLEGPASLALFPPPGGFAGRLLMITLTAAIVSGLVRLGRQTGVTPAHLALAATAALALTWNFPIVNRLLGAFIPLFCLGAIIEGRHVAVSIADTLRSKRPAMDKTIVAGFGLGVALIAASALRSHAVAPSRLLERLNAAADRFASENEAYRWLETNAAPDAPTLAYADSRLYLETGLPTSWPTVFTTDILFGREGSLENQFDSYFDTARHLGAHYWLVTPDEMAADTPTGSKWMAEAQSRLPVVFTSTDGRVRIYDLTPVVRPGASRDAAELNR